MNDQPDQAQSTPAPAPKVYGDQVEPTEKHLTLEFEPDFKFFIVKDTVDDMRFFDLYATVSENEFKVNEIIKFMIGPEAYDSIFEYYESKGQKFRISKFMEVFGKLDKALNSDPDFLNRSASISTSGNGQTN